jgi:hypothetical protein
LYAPAAAGALVEALVTNTTLKHLCISHNNIAAAEAATIAQGVAANATLQSLDISSNPVRSNLPSCLAALHLADNMYHTPRVNVAFLC